MSEIINAADAPNEPERADGRLDRHAPPPSSAHTSPSRTGASRGQTLFEYALIILFVVLAVVLSLALIAPALNNIFNQVPNAF